MTPTYAATERPRRIFVPAPAESVRPAAAAPPAQDPPIYRALIRTWAERGRTLPGRHDPEWIRLTAPPVLYGYGQFSVTPAPRGDGR
jgi:hypothetical protein